MRKPRNYTRHLVCLILALAGLLSATTLMPEPEGRASAQAPGPSWSLTGSLNVGRYEHTATLLPNGQVLVAGGRVSQNQGLANIETSYLLQKMEQYEGIAILATNLRQNLDEAFTRRLQ